MRQQGALLPFKHFEPRIPRVPNSGLVCRVRPHITCALAHDAAVLRVHDHHPGRLDAGLGVGVGVGLTLALALALTLTLRRVGAREEH